MLYSGHSSLRKLNNSLLLAMSQLSLLLLLFLATLLATMMMMPAVPFALASTTSSLGVHIVRSPESAVAPKGDEVVFECELNLVPERLEWRFRHTNDRATNSNNFNYIQVEDSNIINDERTSKLRIFVSPETLGDYQCVAWFGSAAIASVSARLTLVSISIDNSNGYSRNAIRWSVAPKNFILIRCGSVTSNPPAVWSFFRNGEKVPQTEVLPSNGALILNSVTAKDAGNYTCSAMNAITGVEVKLPQRIDLRVDYTDRTPPYFLIQPATQVTARPGETIVLECPGVGSPPPGAVWSSPNVMNINNNRTKTLPYGLLIVEVQAEDQGTYVCRLDNGISPALVHIIKLNVLQRPVILRGPTTTLTNEGDSLELECSATGNPQPDIYWLINGDDTSQDNETYHEDRRLVIKHVQKRHAGIVQCFAKNEVGETSEGDLLRVNPKQIQGEIGAAPLGNVPVRTSYEHAGSKNKAKRKHMKMPNMIPPSRPNVTRLSDDSVMLRWYVPKNEGLPIQFFKVQYRMLGDTARKIPRENWQTTNEDIPYGKRDRNYEGFKNFTSSVSGLKPDRNYRFRIIAVYSNNDNKEGNTSAKFFLQRGSALGPSKSNLPAPELMRVESLSETAVALHWTLPETNQSVPLVEGFYAYYRPSASAAEYLKATVDGMHARTFRIDNLEPGTAYEFKLQSFSALAASEFSTILQGKTKKPPTTPPPATPAMVPTSNANEEDNSIYPVVAGAAGGGILLLIATIAACLCMRHRKSSQNEEEDKPQIDHIQADFVTPSVLGVPSHHKSGHRLNGVMPRMNITPNPLAQEADKNRNVMEMSYIPNSSAGPLSPRHPQQQQQNQGDEQNSSNRSMPSQTQSPDQRNSSSCETLEAGEGVTIAHTSTNLPLSKPLPPLPGRVASSGDIATNTHATTQQMKSTGTVTTATTTTTGTHLQSSSHTQLHHAQPYHQSNPGTPGMPHKTYPNYQLQQQQHYQQPQLSAPLYQQPPPVPPHQNIANANALHHANLSPYHQSNAVAAAAVDQHRRTLERSARNLHYPPQSSLQYTQSPSQSSLQLHTSTQSPPHDAAMNVEGLPTRIPSLRRKRRTSGNGSNKNGGVGIPIVPASPRVQRSPMPARSMMKRNRLGSHNDNMSSGSLNSIEV